MSIGGVGSGNSYLYQGVNRGDHRNKGNIFSGQTGIFGQAGIIDEPGLRDASERSRTSTFLDTIGSNAPEKVRQAWMEAEKESGGFITTFGLFITSDGKHAFMTQAGIDHFVRWYRGERNHDNLLGNSVESAVRAVKKWIYDFDHPLEGQYPGDAQEQRLYRMERKFYETFLQKLQVGSA